jgi:CheY-like chemotaxis protein
VVIAVSDTGTGMVPEVLDRIFEPFFTTKDVDKGTGLGLSVVFGFVKQSGGHIKAYSEVDLGTSVRLYLPRAHGAPADEAAATVAHVPPTARAQERVLVVEDNDMIRALVLQQLAILGYRPVAASNGAEALAVVDSGVPIDLLFTDVVMPGGMSGHELARRATARRPGLKVLFTSGFPGGAHGLPADVPTEAIVLAKPYRMQELADRLREALDG